MLQNPVKRFIIENLLNHGKGKWLAQKILWIFGFEIEGSFPQNNRKFIVIIAPHRKGLMDVLIGWCIKTLKLTPAPQFFAKHEAIYHPVYGWALQELGGIAIDRNHEFGTPKNHSYTDQAIHGIKEGTIPGPLGIAPEGTRKLGVRFHTSFYHIALAVGWDVIPVGIDYKSKKVIIGVKFPFTGNASHDACLLTNWFNAHVKKYDPIIEVPYFEKRKK